MVRPRFHPCLLFTDFSDVEAIECSGDRHQKPKTVAKRAKLSKKKNKKIKISKVKAQFGPALCHHCRGEADKCDRYGWGYLNELEAKVISLIRRSEHMDTVMKFLEEQAIEFDLRSIRDQSVEIEKQDGKSEEDTEGMRCDHPMESVGSLRSSDSSDDCTTIGDASDASGYCTSIDDDYSMWSTDSTLTGSDGISPVQQLNEMNIEEEF